MVKLTSALALGAFAFGAIGSVAAPARADIFVAAPAFRVAQADPTFRRPGHLRAFITSYDHFNMMVAVHGEQIAVALHQGTIIRPTGLTLQPHMLVRIDGVFAAGVFQADRIVLVR